MDSAATQILKNDVNEWSDISWQNTSAAVGTVLVNNPSILDSGWHYFNADGSATAGTYVYDATNSYHTIKKVDGKGAILTFSCKAEDLMLSEYDAASQLITSLSVTVSKNAIYDSRFGVYTVAEDGTYSMLTDLSGSTQLNGNNQTGVTASVENINLSAGDTIMVLIRTGSDAGYSQITGVSFAATTVVPEPATATLSLLALAGLAARRRRR